MKTLQLLMLLALSAPLHAQETTSVTEKETALGKLFLTPEKRQSLDRQRLHNIRTSQDNDGETLQLNGIVQRSSGRHSAWINQRMQHDGSSGGTVSITVNRASPAQAALQGTETAPVQLRVGESLNRSTRERRDVVAPNAIQPGKPRRD